MVSPDEPCWRIHDPDKLDKEKADCIMGNVSPDGQSTLQPRQGLIDKRQLLPITFGSMAIRAWARR